MRKTVVLLASMTLAVLLASGVALAAAGDLDPSFDGPSFDGNGKVILEQAGGASAVAVHPDGGLVVVGASSDGILVVRLKSDGNLDDSFGGGDGVVTTNIQAAGGYGGKPDVVVRPDGKIVVAGTSVFEVALLRYNPNGTLDDSFGGGDGKAYADFGYKEFANALVRYDGGVVAAGYKQGPPQGADTLQKFALARFTSDGRLEQRFGGDGRILTDIISGGHSHASDLIAQGDGKLVAAGGSDHGDFANPDFALARYGPGGRLDNSFGGGDGKVLTDFGVASGVGGLALQANGKIVAAGSAGGKVALARYLAE